MTYRILERFTDGSPEWLAQRRQGIGASDVAAILGLSPWSTPYRVFLDKLGQRWQEPSGEQLEAGHRMEPVTAQWTADHHPEIGHVGPGLDLQSVEYPWLMAKPDRVLYPTFMDAMRVQSALAELVPDTVQTMVEGVGPVFPLELKNSSEYMRDQWDEVPAHYLVQVLTQCIVLGADRGYLTVLIGGYSFRFFEVVVAEHQGLVDRIIAETEAFWDRVQRLDPPPPTDVAEAVHRWPGGGGVARDDGTLWDLMGQMVIAKADEKEAREAADALRVEILKEIGDAETIITQDGKKLATYKAQPGRRHTNLKRLEAEWPDAYADTVTVGEPSRVLRINNKMLMEED